MANLVRSYQILKGLNISSRDFFFVFGGGAGEGFNLKVSERRELTKNRVLQDRRETAIGYKKAKTNRNWVQILHFYHAKTVNIDMRLLWRSVASTKAL